MLFLRKPVLYIGMIMLISSLWATASKERTVTNIDKPSEIYISTLSGPSSIGIAYLFENSPQLDGTESIFNVVASPDVLLPQLLKDETDIGTLPINTAAKVFTANNEAIILGGIVGQGMMSIVSKDTSITSLEDLKGKTITVAGQGSTPEYLIRYLCKEHGIEIGRGEHQIDLDFSLPTQEIAPALLSGKIEYALVPEPFSTVAIMQDSAKTVQRVLDLQSLYKETAQTDNNYPVTAVVIRKEFAEQYPQTVRDFLEAYEYSLLWVNEKPQEAGIAVEKNGLGLNAAVTAQAIPNAALIWQSATDSKQSVEALLSLFLDFAPESIGSKLPHERFYFE
ncbi:MAG: ABC transporter substrate-binding protein [Spirochaetales bacterium]